MPLISPIGMSPRRIAKLFSYNGVGFEPEERIFFMFGAANRDPAMFPDADKVIIDRKENRHAAFGLGIHRCLGSNLARMELRVALESFLARVPPFTLEDAADGADAQWSGGQVRGPRRVALRW